MQNGRIEVGQESFTVDAAIVAENLGIELSVLLAGMRDGRITSVCERGIGDDAGRFRLTFSYGNRRLRLIVDARGVILKILTFDFGNRPLPPRRRSAHLAQQRRHRAAGTRDDS